MATLASPASDSQSQWTTAQATVTVQFGQPTHTVDTIDPGEAPSISEYLPFDIVLERGATEGRYRARVVNSPAGEAMADCTLPFDPNETAGFLASLASRGATEVRGFGERLYQSIFVGPVGSVMQRSLDLVQPRGQGLRVRLHINESALELNELPWELLYAPQLGGFLALSNETLLVRNLAVPRQTPSLVFSPPFTVVAVIASPAYNMPLVPAQLDLELEWRRLQDALSEPVQRGLCRLERLPAATIDSLRGRLASGGPVHALHIVGHTVLDRSRGRGGLVMEDRAGRADVIAAEKLAGMLTGRQGPGLVFLDASAATQGEQGHPTTAIARSLVQLGVPSVAAMQFPISRTSSGALLGSFYYHLLTGAPVDLALTEARRAVFASGDSLAWAAPVLFSSSPDHRLFT